AHCEPVYEDLPGWHASTEGITSYSELPDNAKVYIERLAAITETPIDMISTGPERSETIVLKRLFD
ncbi:MAG: adenylosuccinate synthetase, partial [Gammaproteobacteria bacterium]